MLTADRALVSAEEPALEERSDPVHARQHRLGRFSTAKDDFSIVAIAEVRKAAIALQPVGDHDGTRPDGFLHKPQQALCREIRHPLHTDSANRTAAHLRGDNHQSLLANVSAPTARLDATDEGLVHLNQLGQSIPAGPDHCASEFVEPGPSSAVAAQSEDSLEAKRTGTVLLANQPP